MNQDISITIRDAAGESKSFSKLRSLRAFCKMEEEKWKEYQQKLSGQQSYSPYINAAQRFTQILSRIDQLKDIEDNRLFNQKLQELQRDILNSLDAQWIWSGHPFVSVWIDSYEKSIQTGNAFLEVILQKRANSIQDFNSLKGYLLAYEFEMQNESDLTKRRNSEKKSIAQLRDQLDTKTSELIEEVEEFEDDFTQWSNKTKQDFDRKIKSQKKVFCKSQDKRQKEFDSYMEESKNKISELENTYHEKLRLKEPATYWKDKASSYRTQGFIWGGILLFALIMGIDIFSHYFSLWVQGKALKLELNSFQGAVIFATILAIYIFLIKTLAKMTLSSFHLQRDAEEREQLTHVYLALTNEEGSIDEESRKIVLQALFSRVDSGLLHKDSSPTMPGLYDLVKHAGGNK